MDQSPYHPPALHCWCANCNAFYGRGVHGQKDWETRAIEYGPCLRIFRVFLDERGQPCDVEELSFPTTPEYDNPEDFRRIRAALLLPRKAPDEH